VTPVPAKRAFFSFVPSADNDDLLVASVQDAPFKVKSSVLPLDILSPPDDLNSPQAIATHGAQIRDALMKHSEIRSVLESLYKAPNLESWNILFGVSNPKAEAIRWEVLQTPTAEYLVLGPARRLLRVATATATPELGIRTFPDRLRFAAFLSPAKVDCEAEFDGIVAAADAARRGGLPLDLFLYVGQRELVTKAPAWVTCRLMPASTEDLQEELRRERPHILHFFCHGLSDSPQSLQFATVADQRAQAEDGSVPLSIQRLVEVGLDQVWTVVFNCCDGGRPSKALGSMAYRVVAEAGVPAAIGMGSPLPQGAAPFFSSSFYKALFRILCKLLPQIQNTAVEIDFGDAIADARKSLHDAIAAVGLPFSCWSLPIIYLHSKPFIIQKALSPTVPMQGPAAVAPPDSLEIARRVSTIAGMLQAMPTATPKVVRQQILALFDDPPFVPPALRCDENGAFVVAG
jgi:hypothetical protein